MLFIVPVGSENIEDHKPWAAYGLVLVTVLAYVFGPDTAREAARWGAGGSPDGIVTSMFVHLDLFHLVGNMIFLLVFGGVLAARMHPVKLVGIYLVCGVLSAGMHALTNDVPAIGASGAINGLVGVYLALFPLTRIGFGVFVAIFQVGSFRVPGWLPITLWFALDVLGTLNGPGAVAYVAHLAGFVSGLAIGLALLRFGWFRMHAEDLRTLPELFGRTWRTGPSAPKAPRPPTVTTSRPPAAVRVSRPALEVAPRREVSTAVSMTKLSCACGWTAEVPTIFASDANFCDRCRAPVAAHVGA